MIALLTIVVLAAVGVVAFSVGTVTGKATMRRRHLTYERGIREIGKFARQQAAVGDSTGTVIADMIDNLNEKKELN